MLRIELVKSPIANVPKNRKTVAALGLKKMRQVVFHDDTPAIRGMVHQVKHLLDVQTVEGQAPAKAPPKKARTAAAPKREPKPKAPAAAKPEGKVEAKPKAEPKPKAAPKPKAEAAKPKKAAPKKKEGQE